MVSLSNHAVSAPERDAHPSTGSGGAVSRRARSGEIGDTLPLALSSRRPARIPGNPAMDIDPLESASDAAEMADASRDRGKARLSARVAITVALLATFLGVSKVKDDNIVQAMQQAQADQLDHWNFYQARNIRQEVAAAAAAQLKLAAAGASPAQQEGYRAAIVSYEALVIDQAKKKEDLRLQAEQDQKTYDALNYRDDHFDLP